MLNRIVTILFILLTHLSYTQERWVTIVDGWTCLNVIQKNNEFYSFGLNADGPLKHFYQFQKIDNNGNKLASWNFKIDTTYATTTESSRSMLVHSKGNIFIAGYLMHNNSYNIKPILFKFKADLSDTLKTKYWHYGDKSRTYILEEIEPNKLIVSGINQKTSTDYSVWATLQEIDTLGNIAWQKEYNCGTDCWMEPYKITPLPDGGYFYTNEQRYYHQGELDYVRAAIIRTDAVGNQLWKKYYGGPDVDNERPLIVPTDDGNYILVYSRTNNRGWIDKQIASDANIQVSKIDIDGNLIWNKNYPDKLKEAIYFTSDVVKNPDGTIVIVGKTTTYTGKLVLLKIDQEGNFIWYRAFRPFQNENDAIFHGLYNTFGLTQTSDGGYIVAGEYMSEPSNMFPSAIQTGIVIKVDEFGCIEPDCQLNEPTAIDNAYQLNFSLYPNPTNGFVELTSDEVLESIEITDITGKVVYSETLKTNHKKLDISHLAKGVYYLKANSMYKGAAIRKLVRSE